MRSKIQRGMILVVTILAGSYTFESAACTADVFRALADELDPNHGDNVDFGDWLSDQVDEF